MPLREKHDHRKEFIVAVDDAEEVARVPLGEDLGAESGRVQSRERRRRGGGEGGGEGEDVQRGCTVLLELGGLGVVLSGSAS